jgi:Lon protease-like protein
VASKSIIIPIFPLQLVLLPGEQQQLRVFEPRYKQMLDDCLLQNEPIGLCLTDPFAPILGWDGPNLHGTTARITYHEEQGLDHFIEIQGQRRFRILRIIKPLLPPLDIEKYPTQPTVQKLLEDFERDKLAQPPTLELSNFQRDCEGSMEKVEKKLYLQAEIEFLPELEGELIPESAERLLMIWSAFLEALGNGIGLKDEILDDWIISQKASVANADASSFWRMASILLHDPWAKQALLESEEIGEALEEMMACLSEPI